MDVNPTVRRPLTLDALPSIRKAAATNATRASALSLIHAGLFNLVLFAVVWRGWELIERVSRPGTDLLLLAYGPALLGVGMLLLGAIGRFCPGSAPIALDALAIFVVGTWNILFQFFLEEALRPHGLRLASFTPMWLVLGAMQLKTAVLTAAKLPRVRAWSRLSAEPSAQTSVVEAARALVAAGEAADATAVKAKLVSSTASFVGNAGENPAFSGSLSETSLVFVSNDLQDCFAATRLDCAKGSWESAGHVSVRCDDGVIRKLELSPLSNLAVKAWCEAPITVADLARLSAAEAEPKDRRERVLALVVPCTKSDSPAVRAAALKALTPLRDPGLGHLFEHGLRDSSDEVKLAALEAIRQGKLAELEAAVSTLLAGTAPAVRAATIDCLEVLDSPLAAMAREADALARRNRGVLGWLRRSLGDAVQVPMPKYRGG